RPRTPASRAPWLPQPISLTTWFWTRPEYMAAGPSVKGSRHSAPAPGLAWAHATTRTHRRGRPRGARLPRRARAGGRRRRQHGPRRRARRPRHPGRAVAGRHAGAAPHRRLATAVPRGLRLLPLPAGGGIRRHEPALGRTGRNAARGPESAGVVPARAARRLVRAAAGRRVRGAGKP